MDKQKNKTDLRAAGEKRLRQFRENKQKKGGHDKSTDKRKNVADVATTASAAVDASTNLKHKNQLEDESNVSCQADNTKAESVPPTQDGANGEVATDNLELPLSSVDVVKAEEVTEIQNAKRSESSALVDNAPPEDTATTEVLRDLREDLIASTDTIVEKDSEHTQARVTHSIESIYFDPAGGLSSSEEVTSTTDTSDKSTDQIIENKGEQLSMEDTVLPKTFSDPTSAIAMVGESFNSCPITDTSQHPKESHIFQLENTDATNAEIDGKQADGEKQSTVTSRCTDKGQHSLDNSQELVDCTRSMASEEVKIQEPCSTAPEPYNLPLERLANLEMESLDQLEGKHVIVVDTSVANAEEVMQLLPTDITDTQEPDYTHKSDDDNVHVSFDKGKVSMEKQSSNELDQEKVQHLEMEFECKLKTVMDKRDAPARKLDNEAMSQHIELQNSEKRLASEISQLRALIGNTIKTGEMSLSDPLISREAETLEFQLCQLKEELQQVLMDKNNYSHELDTFRTSCETLRHDKEELEKELKLLREELELFKSDTLQKHEEEVKKVVVELQECKKHLEDLTRERDLVIENMQLKDQEIFDLQTERARYQQEIAVVENLEKENRRLFQQSDELTQNVEKLEGERTSLRSELMLMEQKLQASEDCKANSMNEVCRLEEESRKKQFELIQNLEAVNLQLEEAQKENINLQRMGESLSQQVQHLSDVKDKLDTEIKSLKSELTMSSKMSNAEDNLELKKGTDKSSVKHRNCKVNFEDSTALQAEPENILDAEVQTFPKIQPPDQISILKAHLGEFQLTSERLQKTIQAMSLYMTNSPSGSSRGSISKLIKAFESKSHQEDLKENNLVQEEDISQRPLEKSEGNVSSVLPESNSLHQLVKDANVDIQCLRDVLVNVETDTNDITQYTFEAMQQRDIMSAALVQLEVDINRLKKEKEAKDDDCLLFSKKNEQLEAQILEESSQIESLRLQLSTLEQDTVMKTEILEAMNKDLLGQISALKEEINFCKTTMLGAAENLEQCGQYLGCDFPTEEFSSVDVRFSSIINICKERVRSLKEIEKRLELCNHENLELQTSYKEVVQQLESMKQEKAAVCVRFGKLIEAESVSPKAVQTEDMPPESKENADVIKSTTSFIDMMQVFEKFEKMRDELSHFKQKATEVESILTSKDSLIEELDLKCSELLRKVIENDIVSNNMTYRLTELNDEKDALNFELAQCKARVCEFQRTLSEKDIAIEELNTKCSELLAKLLENDNYITVVNSQLAELTNQNQLRSVELARTKDALADHQSKMEADGKLHENINCILIALSEKLASVTGNNSVNDSLPTSSVMDNISCLEACVNLSVDKYKMSIEQYNEFQLLMGELASRFPSYFAAENVEMPLHIALEGFLKKMEEELNGLKVELEQKEHKCVALKDKLTLAVSKGKGLVQQRDALRKSLAEKSNELETCQKNLDIKTAALHEAELKIKSYEHSGERIESLELELAYIRNSTTSLRESLYHKDSIFQKIEDILDPLNLPEEIQLMELHEKIEWLAIMYSNNNNNRSCSMDNQLLQANRENDTLHSEDLSLNSRNGQDLEEIRKKYSEIQSKYISLAEQSDMLEQSLHERTHLIEKWEEALNRVSIPASVQLLEPEVRIEWLGNQLRETEEHERNLQDEIQTMRDSMDFIVSELEKSRQSISILGSELSSEKHEKELLFCKLEELNSKCEHMIEHSNRIASEKEALANNVTNLHYQLENMNSETEVMVNRLVCMIETVLKNEVSDGVSSKASSFYLESTVKKLIDRYNVLLKEADVQSLNNQEKVQVPNDVSPVTNDISALDAAVGEKEHELQKMHSKLEESNMMLDSYKSEQDKLVSQSQNLLKELDLSKLERDDLQQKLEQSDLKLLSTKDKLVKAVRKGKGTMQECETLKQSLHEKNAEIQQLRVSLDEKEAEIQQLQVEFLAHEQKMSYQESKIKELLANLEQLKGQELETINWKNQSAELEKSLFERDNIIQHVMVVLDTIKCIHEQQCTDPVQAVEILGKSYNNLQEKVSLFEEETKKSKRAAELLAAELDEVNERMETIEEELTISRTRASALENEKSAAEQAHKDAQLNLQQALSSQANDLQHYYDIIKKQHSGISKCFAGFQKLRKEQAVLFDLLGNDFRKKVELLKEMEVSVQGVLSHVSGSKTFKASSTLTKLLEEAENMAAEPFMAMVSKEQLMDLIENNIISHQGKMPEEYLSSLENLVEECLHNLGIFKTRLDTNSAALREGFQAVSELGRLSVMEAEAMKIANSDACSELQGQIRRAHSAIKSISQERDIAKSRIIELEKQYETYDNEYHSLKMSFENLKLNEASSKKLEEEIKSLHDTLATKNQELEDVMQMFDELEGQSEQLKSRVKELEITIQEKTAVIETLEAACAKAKFKLSITSNRLIELTEISEGLAAEIDALQQKVESREADISYLREEVTRYTNEALVAQEKMKSKVGELRELHMFVEAFASKFSGHQPESENNEGSRTQALLGAIENRVSTIISDSENLQTEFKSKDVLLQDAQSKLHELSNKVNSLEALLVDKDSQVERLKREKASTANVPASSSEVSEIEEIGQIGKRSHALVAAAPHVRSVRKMASEQLGISIDLEAGQSSFEVEDDDKGKGYVFKSLTTSRLIPKVTRPVADRLDGIWVSCSQLLMRQPAARLGVVIYWVLLHYFTMALLL